MPAENLVGELHRGWSVAGGSLAHERGMYLRATTYCFLLAAIGIAGMDRALQANVLAKSGKAVEVAGDIDTLLLV